MPAYLPYELLVLPLSWLVLGRLSPTLGRRMGPWVVPACLAYLCLHYMSIRMFVDFRIYDDEGYVLNMIARVLAGHPLHDEVYSQYGPSLIALWKPLTWLGVPVTHTSGRLIALGCWALTAVAIAMAAWRMRNSSTLALLSGAFAVSYLQVICNEPPHPSTLIMVATVLFVLLLPTETGAGSRTLRAIICGALVAIVALMKLNVGACLGLGLAAIMLVEGWPTKPLLRWLGAATLAAFPIALMGRQLGQPDVLLFASMSTVAIVSLLVWAPHGARVTLGQSAGIPVGSLVTGLFLSGCVIVAVALAGGSSPAGLLDGVLLAHLRVPHLLRIELPFLPGTLFALCLPIVAGLTMGRLGPAARWHLARLPSLLAMGLALASHCHLVPLRPEAVLFSFFLPAACVRLIAGDDEGTGGGLRWRLRLVLISAFTLLQAYPVAGTQMAVGSMLLVPVVFDAGLEWFGRLPSLCRLSGAGLRGAPFVGAALGAAVSIAGVFMEYQWTATRMARHEELGLPGSRFISLSLRETANLRILCDNARLHGDMLVTRPGLLSFNLWTALPTPTERNVTGWMHYLSAQEQERSVRALRAADRPLCISEEINWGYMLNIGSASDGPLVSHLTSAFEPVFALGTYTFSVAKGRSILPVGLFSSVETSSQGAVRVQFAMEADKLPRDEGVCELWDLPFDAPPRLLATVPSDVLKQSRPAHSPAGVFVWTATFPCSEAIPPAWRLCVILRDSHGKSTAFALAARP